MHCQAPLLLLPMGISLIPAVLATIDTQLVGTWSTKSAKVLTGSAFYNPVNDSLIEPSHTGISYSFTSDGFYEESYYRAISNPTTPSCPQAIMQWQHGSVVQNADKSLTLTPIAVDGRQLQSDPCGSSTSTYTRYNQSEMMLKWAVYIDPYTKLTRLDLYRFDGSPMNPMFLAYSPPQMLPTTTLNPTSVSSVSPTATGNSKRGAKLSQDQKHSVNRNDRDSNKPLEISLLHKIDLNVVWWAGVGLTIFGGAVYIL